MCMGRMDLLFCLWGCARGGADIRKAHEGRSDDEPAQIHEGQRGLQFVKGQL